MTDPSPSAPRVLVSGVLFGQPRGGVRRHNAELLPRLHRLLAEGGGGITVLEGRARIAFALPDEIERVTSDVPDAPPWRRALAESRALRRARVEASRPFDLVHTAHLPAPRALPVPFTLTIHDLRKLDRDSTSLLPRLLARRVIRDATTRAARTFVVSESTRAELTRLSSAARIVVAPNGADHFAPLPRTPERDAPLLCVGHLEARKNLELLLHALRHDETLPDLWLVGAAKGKEGERLESRARALGVRERVRFLGAIDDEELIGLYARAAALVAPSRIEGFGIPVVEAQRAGVPVAIADAGALPEVAAPETPRFSPDDPRGCATAIARALVADAATIERAREHAARYRWDETARRIAREWITLIGQRSSASSTSRRASR